MTNNECNEFNRLYCQLNESDRDLFKNTTIKLLKVNFFLRLNNELIYIFLINHKELFSYFFRFINFDFIVREDKDLVYIKANDGTLVNKLYKNETIALLVLMLMYQEKLDVVTLSENIEITVKELQEKLFAVGFSEGTTDRVKKSTLRDMIYVFKTHNIIYYSGDLEMDDTVITIYPSIEVCVDFKELDDIRARLDSLNEGGDDDE